ncbi:PREDICTED: insecticyanin-B-like [Papilio polytes]|uniref:Bilin binding protein 2 n=1 Tax=Papilio polytes TaxID=76194 RepID=I4DLT4_PAPPL|nr:insecticyanin-B-like precursor [Papilio polytes]BAM18874.1 bilin binding protein 2 [Papilio polytes]BBV14730.1 bilin-binding protein [Papilio polytes]
MLRFTLFAIFVASASAVSVIFEDGPCPNFKPMSNFDFSAYGGTWYEIAKFPNPSEEGDKAKCTLIEYFVKEFRGKMKFTHVVDGARKYIEGDLTQVYPGSGKIMYTYTFGGKAKNTYLYVMDTDYNNYAVAFSCRYFKDSDKHQLLAWILSRNKVLEGNALAAVDKFLAANSKLINTSYFVQNEHTNEACKARTTEEITEFLKIYETNPNLID